MHHDYQGGYGLSPVINRIALAVMISASAVGMILNFVKFLTERLC
jgi:hypothetical protein